MMGNTHRTSHSTQAEEVKEYLEERGQEVKETLRRTFRGNIGLLNSALILQAILSLLQGVTLLASPSYLVPGFVAEAKSGLSMIPILRSFATQSLALSLLAGYAAGKFEPWHKSIVNVVFLAFHTFALGDMALLGWSQSGAFKYSPVLYHLPMAILMGGVALSTDRVAIASEQRARGHKQF